MFKVPTNVPQDLLLIQELIQPQPEKQSQEQHARASSIDSSAASTDGTTDSEEEEAVESLLEKDGGGLRTAPASPPSVHDSEDSSTDTDSESESDDGELATGSMQPFLDDVDDDEEDGNNKQTAGAVLRTKNEIPEPSVVVPDFAEVDAHEPLERVGEVMNIIDNVVIVKGTPSPVENRAAERALDSDSLLVFEDRKVLGYVHETFGPTHLPMYQVKFPTSVSIDKNIVQVARSVYHVPTWSKFIFPSQLAKFKGSDASNMHDEEIGEDEAEFSDDEAEAAYKRQRARDRESRRSSSAASSRHSTPIPSQVRDQELMDEMFYGASPYDEYTPYDMDSTAGPSRPTPLPYDDPYADGVNTSQDSTPMVPEDNVSDRPESRGGHVRARGRPNRGRGRGRDERHGGRQQNGRGTGRRGGDRGRGTGQRGGYEGRPRQESSSYIQSRDSQQVSNGIQPRPLSPTSLAIARVTGQQANPTLPGVQPMQNSFGVPVQPGHQQNWQYPSYGSQPANYTAYPTQDYLSQPYVQPHINPRFASHFALNMNFLQPQQHAQGYQNGASNWSNPWGQNLAVFPGNQHDASMDSGGSDERPFSNTNHQPT